MINSEIIFFIVLAYLTGALPSSIWIGRLFYNVDVREFGSGNAGATNTFRVLGYKAGIPVLLIDILKGWIAVKYTLFLSHFLLLDSSNIDVFFETQLVFGIAAVLGHLFPIYVGFRGGKGIATMLGILIAIHPPATFYSLVIFCIVLFLFRYVSLSSIVASLSFAIIIIIFYNDSVNSLKIFAIFVPILSLITHQKNIERIIKGEETKLTFEKK